ncbi:MAG: acyltransferase family protein [Pseudomonadota bacterium]
MKYRRDIDGLRALAVVPVVLFHAHLPVLPGGYVGVDIFFVISGFLITGILHREITNDTFTFADFYERRARRILPALIAVLTTTLVVAAALMLPDDFEDATTSAAAALFSVANILFWLDSGYFSGPAEAKPLLHTWSLGVEEQFYIFWPIILIVLARIKRPSLPLAIGIITIVSFTISEWQVQHAPDAAFYLLPSRAWQLAVGGGLAIGMITAPRSQRLATIAATAGLLAIVVAMLTFTPRTPFPGVSALLPTLGAALIIWSGTGQTPWVARLLSVPPMVGIGLISYALYLWHWPVFVLAKYVSREPLSGLSYVFLTATAVALAALTYRFIEQPFRRRDGAFPLPRLTKTLGGATVLLLAVSAWSYATSGIPNRLPEDARRIAAIEASFGIADDQCLNRGLERISNGDLCQLGEKNLADAAPGFLLWGDSHAEAMAPAFETLARTHGASGLYAARDACPPVMGATQWPTIRNKKCPAFQKAMLNQARRSGIRDVVLVARWNLYHNGWPETGIESAASADFLIHDAQTKMASVEENARVLARALRKTVATLRAANKRVWLVTQVPYVGFRVPTELALVAFSPVPQRRARPSPDAHRQRSKAVAQLFQELAKDRGVFILDPSHRMCARTTCRIESSGVPLYRDDDHLSREGAAFIVPTLIPLVDALTQH